VFGNDYGKENTDQGEPPGSQRRQGDTNNNGSEQSAIIAEIDLDWALSQLEHNGFK